ncbi:hypothetical protein [Streptomyces sp. bgisy082]|uniref:hypothetical protein n=1 Tax=Streptomyces sp. bgisy082 TaxID=3413776 RepID=UPI003D724E65
MQPDGNPRTGDRGETWIADMVRAVTALHVEPSDHEKLSRIATLLGMAKGAPARQAPGGGAAPRAAPPSPPASSGVESARQKPSAGHGRVEAQDERLQVLRPVSTPAPDDRRSWSEPALAEQRRGRAEDPPFETLLPPTSESATLHLVLSRVVREGPVDVNALLDTVCRGDVLSQLPREPVRTLRFGVQVLVDLGMGMQPFHRDQSELVRRIGALAGEHSRDVRYFSESPLHGSGKEAGWSWKAYEPPPPGARVLILSDFGLHAEDVTPQLKNEWLQTVQLIKRAGCRPLALVPAPPEAWPHWLVALMPVLSWDRRTTTARVHAVLS